MVEVVDDMVESMGAVEMDAAPAEAKMEPKDVIAFVVANANANANANTPDAGTASAADESASSTVSAEAAAALTDTFLSFELASLRYERLKVRGMKTEAELEEERKEEEEAIGKEREQRGGLIRWSRDYYPHRHRHNRCCLDRRHHRERRAEGVVGEVDADADADAHADTDTDTDDLFGHNAGPPGAGTASASVFEECLNLKQLLDSIGSIDTLEQLSMFYTLL